MPEDFRQASIPIVIYCVLCLFFSLTYPALIFFENALLASVVFTLSVTIFLFAYLRPSVGLILTLTAALTMGWLITNSGQYNVHFTKGLVLAFVAGVLINNLRHRLIQTFPAQLFFFAFSGLAVLSFIITAVKIYSYQPLPQAGFINIAINVISTGTYDLLLNSFQETSQYLFWPGLFFSGLILAKDQQRILALVRCCLAVILLLNVLISVVQMYIVPNLFAASGYLFDGRANGLMSFCNAMSNAMALIVIFAPMWWSREKNLLNKCVNWLVLLSALVLVYLGGGRAPLGYLALVVVVWAGYRLYRSNNRQVLLKKGLYIGGIAVTVLALTMLIEGVVFNRTPMLMERFGVLIENFNLDYFIFLRAGMWGFATFIIGHHFLGGVGIGTYFSELANYSTLMGQKSWFIDNALNQYLHITAELGIFALLFFLGVLVVIIRQLWQATTWSRYISIALICYLPVLFFGPHINDPETGLFFWLLTGFTLGLALRQAGLNKASQISRLQKGLVISGVLIFSVFSIVGSIQYSPRAMWQKLRWNVETGLHERESKRWSRWTKPLAMLTIKPRRPIMILTWRTGDEHMHSISQHVTMKLADSVITDTVVTSPDFRRAIAILPDNLIAQRISIEVEPGFVPAESFESEDERRLGIYLKSIWFPKKLNPEQAGWYAIENDGDLLFRWGKRESHLVLEHGIDHHLEFRPAHGDIATNPVKLDIFLNHKLLESRVLNNSNWQTITIRSDQFDNQQYSNSLLTFRLDRIWVPANETGGDDKRELGIALKIPGNIREQ